MHAHTKRIYFQRNSETKPRMDKVYAQKDNMEKHRIS